MRKSLVLTLALIGLGAARTAVASEGRTPLPPLEYAAPQQGYAEEYSDEGGGEEVESGQEDFGTYLIPGAGLPDQFDASVCAVNYQDDIAEVIALDPTPNQSFGGPQLIWEGETGQDDVYLASVTNSLKANFGVCRNFDYVDLSEIGYDQVQFLPHPYGWRGGDRRLRPADLGRNFAHYGPASFLRGRPGYDQQRFGFRSDVRNLNRNIFGRQNFPMHPRFSQGGNRGGQAQGLAPQRGFDQQRGFVQQRGPDQQGRGFEQPRANDQQRAFEQQRAEQMRQQQAQQQQQMQRTPPQMMRPGPFQGQQMAPAFRSGPAQQVNPAQNMGRPNMGYNVAPQFRGRMGGGNGQRF